jgi:apolipoprotein N-acyltransferase
MRGTEHTVFDFGKFNASILICYDGTFSENVRDFVRNGAELLVNISNDAWFGFSSEITQHGSFYPFRAVESGRTIIRASNVGISEVILPDGTRENQTNLFERTSINRKVPLYQYDTIYLKYGNWFLYLVLIITCGFRRSDQQKFNMLNRNRKLKRNERGEIKIKQKSEVS